MAHQTSAKAHETGALVVGGEHPGLGVARSLGRRGIPVVVVDDQQSVSAFSRYVSKVVRVEDLRAERATVDAILDVGKRLGLRGWVLFPTRDETVAAFSKHRTELAEFFRVTTPDWTTTEWAWDKKKTYELSERLGIPCPKTFNQRGEAELDALRDRLPLAIKPAVKEHFFYATHAKAWRADTIEQLHARYAEARKYIRAEEILVQEIVEGDGDRQFSYCAFFKNGEAHSTLLARRERQHPREFGRAATYVETIDLPVIEELSERFLKAIDYYGLVEIEYKQDVRDGEYKLLDVNARTWGFHALGFPAGVDFPYLLFADQLGEAVPRKRASPRVGWLRVITDIPTVSVDLLLGHVSPSRYIESLRRTRIESVFAMDDPVPSLAEIGLLPYQIVKKYL
jgi:D-aspartate ligase